MTRSAGFTTKVPHSWRVKDWPALVYPNTPQRGRYIVRIYRDDLMREGALARVGRELVVFGGRYTQWLQKRAALVPDYTAFPQRPQHTEGTAA